MSDLPEALASAIEPFASAFGIAHEVAPLLLLQIAGAVAGGSVRTTSPDLVDCTPAFDIACVHDGQAMLHGAVLTAFDAAIHEIVTAGSAYASMDRRVRCSRRDGLKMRNAELATILAKKEARLQELKPDPFAERTVEQLLESIVRQSPLEEIARLEEELPKLRDEHGKVQRELLDLMINLFPGVVRDRTDWRDFVTAGAYALDGHFLQMATAGSLLAETASTSHQLRSCAEMLQRARSESPISGFNTGDTGHRPCMNLSGTDEEFAALLRHPRLKNIGILDGCVFVDIDSEHRPNVDALVQFGEHEWHDLNAKCFRLRATGMCNHLKLDRDGCDAYFAFRDWCREFSRELPVEHRVYFLRWPELAVRMATSLAIIANPAVEGVLDPRWMQSAAAMLKDHGARQAAVLSRLTGVSANSTRENPGVDKLVQRLRLNGPLSRRDLARGISGQDYRVIDARIFAAVSQGLVFQKDGLFYAVDVNVNASTEPTATAKEGVVAA